MPLLALRTHLEDRTLKEELPGYGEYMKEVKYRLIPFVWGKFNDPRRACRDRVRSETQPKHSPEWLVGGFDASDDFFTTPRTCVYVVTVSVDFFSLGKESLRGCFYSLVDSEW